jgi:hypothetical protein
MPKPGLADQRPSRVSQALVIGFSLGVVFMAGWLVLMIMFSHDGNSTTVATADLSVPINEVPHVENLPPDRTLSARPRVAPPSGASPWPDPPTPGVPFAVTAPRPAAPPADDPPPTPAYAVSSLPAPGFADRIAPGDDPAAGPVGEAAADTGLPEIVPLPPSRPRGGGVGATWGPPPPNRNPCRVRARRSTPPPRSVRAACSISWPIGSGSVQSTAAPATIRTG